MADGIAITAGAGTVVQTDDVGGVHYQQVKLVNGTLGATDAIPGDATNGLDVDVTRLPALPAGTNNIGDVDVLTLIPGTGATALGKAEDAAHTTGDTGVAVFGVRSDTTPSSTAGTAGDYTLPNFDANGRLYVNCAIYDAAGAAITQASDFTHDAALTPSTTAGPATILRATDTGPAAVSAADDAVLAQGSLAGKQVVLLGATPGATWQYAAASGGITNTTAVPVKAAAGAGVRNYITGGEIINGHATVSTEVLIRDGAAGTVIHRGWAQAGGGGFQINRILRGSANTLLEAVPVTTGSAIYVNLSGYAAAE